ncbi:hypothetical protein D3C80_1562340 [compost metagenome]
MVLDNQYRQRLVDLPRTARAVGQRCGIDLHSILYSIQVEGEDHSRAGTLLAFHLQRAAHQQA